MVISSFLFKDADHLRRAALRWNHISEGERLAAAKSCFLGPNAPERPAYFVGMLEDVDILLPVDRPETVVYRYKGRKIVNYFVQEPNGVEGPLRYIHSDCYE